jgi:aminoglycoside phosphotransferase family enzyme/predicted kinase
MEHAPASAPVRAGDGSQAAVIEFLSRPDAYPNAAGGVSQIGTHAALVFLAGDRAYKLKRAVKLPYLDFSTLEQRRAALDRELEVNCQATPELYLSVIPMTRGPAGFELGGGSGEVVEWLLVMRRFGQDALLDTLASKGALDRGCVADLGHTIEHFHRQAPPVRNAGFGRNFEEVAGSLRDSLCSAGAQAKGLHLQDYIGRLWRELETRMPLIEEREREGFVRRCHGDLHLKNLVLWEGRPRLFDAIEFDERIATIDVLYDLAFLLMDLWHRGLKHEANTILNHYLQRAAISELAGLSLLPLFLSVRAAIRAMTGLHALAFQDAADQQQPLREIESYAALAGQLLSPGPPVLVAIGGISGTGKTSVAREVASFIGAVPGALHLRTDVERKVIQGVALSQPLPQEAYAAEARDDVYRRIFKKAEVALDAGHSAIVDAVFPDEAGRALLHELAQGAGVAFWGFWLEADASVIRQRIAARHAGEADASDADIAVAEAQMTAVTPPPDWIGIDASGPPESAAAAILAKLGGQAPPDGASQAF